jgi:hypothetical protein
VYIVSDRADTSVTQHREIVGNVVTALGDNVNFISASAMIYHYTHRSNFSNQGFEMGDEAENGSIFDRTGITFDQMIIIKPQFWP